MWGSRSRKTPNRETGGTCGFPLGYLILAPGERPLTNILISKLTLLQMLHAVQVIHEEKIVHSDLKPANFVLVKGSLKLIDFGIAKAIPNDTTNIQREQQVSAFAYFHDGSTEPGGRIDRDCQLHEPRGYSRHPRDGWRRARDETGAG